MNEQPAEVSIFQNLQGALGSECPNCGHVNSSDADNCEECGESLLMEEEEEAGFSYMQAEGTPLAVAAQAVGVSKIPLEESKNLIMLQDTVDAAQAGEITQDEYQSNVGKILELARVNSEMFNGELMKEQLAKIPEEYRALVEETGQLWQEYFDAASRMMEYDGNNIAIAEEGLGMVEDVLWKMDKFQDRLMMKSSQLQPEVDKEKEEEEAAKEGGQNEETDDRTYA